MIPGLHGFGLEVQALGEPWNDIGRPWAEKLFFFVSEKNTEQKLPVSLKKHSSREASPSEISLDEYTSGAGE